MRGVKSIFDLNDTNVTKYCNYFTHIHPEIHIEIEKSPNENHNSFYIRMYLNEDNSKCTSLRISDHHTKLTLEGTGIRNIIVSKNTKGQSIINMLEKTYDALLYKTRMQNLEKLYDNIREKH